MKVSAVVLRVKHRTPSCGKAGEVVHLSELFLRRAVELDHCVSYKLQTTKSAQAFRCADHWKDPPELMRWSNA